MENISISLEPINATSLYPTPQTVSDGGFSQSLQDAVDAGSTNVPSAPSQSGELQQTAQETQPQDQNAQLQEEAQAAQPVQDSQPQKSTEAVLEKPEEMQEAQTAQPQEEPVHNDEAKVMPHYQPGSVFAFVVKTDDADEPDSDVMKELEDLLNKNEDMLSAPERMKETIKDMITQAFAELSDPDVTEEEFTEMVLDFLMKYIQEKFGGENEDTSVVGDSEDDDDLKGVRDVLMQVVVQMLDNIRSEEQQPEIPEEETVDGVPAAGKVEDAENTVQIDPLTDEAELLHDVEGPSYRADETDVAETQTEKTEEQATVEEPSEVLPETRPEEKTYSPEVYQAAMETAQAIYTAITTQPQTAESSQVQPADTNRSSTADVPAIQPMDELEELTRLVKGGETVRSEQPQLDLTSGKQEETEPVQPAAQLEAVGETVPFEAVVASTVPQVTLTRPFEGSESGAVQIVTQIASEIFNQLPENGGTTTFVMTLNPESLGKVTVKLVEEAGKISVSVVAHEKRTAELLAQRFDTLQTAMKENGTQLEKYQVVYEPEQSEGSGQQSFDGSSKNPYVKQDDEESEGSGEFAELLQQAV